MLVLAASLLVMGGVWGMVWLLSRDGGGGASHATAGYEAPDFELETVDGGSVRLKDLRGKKVLVNFWATWCPPCKAEMPQIQEAYEEHKHGDDDFEVIAINATVSDDDAGVPAFVELMGLTFHVAYDRDGAVMKKYNVPGLPTSFFIDEKGIIRKVHSGVVDREFIEDVLKEL